MRSYHNTPYEDGAPRVSDIRPAPRRPLSAWEYEPLYAQEDRYAPVVPPQDGKQEEQAPVSFPETGERRAAFREAGISDAGKKVLGIVLLGCAAAGLGGLAVRAGMEVKQNALQSGEAGYGDLLAAVESLKSEQYAGSLSHFNDAYREFSRAEEGLTFWGGALADFARFVPGLSKAASGKHVIEAGKHFALAGVPLSSVAADVSLSKDAYAQGEKISLLDFLMRIREPLAKAAVELEAANEDLEAVRIDDLPEEKREKFLMVKQSLPALLGTLKGFRQNEALLQELLGGNGPRKYLFLLQNNHEMRGTGGFIGSYALLDVNDGVVRRFFVDGIFNPDGQLRENIVPPQPIQKISAAWSLHDSNWFPDFPLSAEKAIFFYEKTGGPTVDGVITLTPTVMQKLLSAIGPLTLEKYGVTVDAENFIPVVQEQVEVKYDREENRPKQILADLSALLIEKTFTTQERATLFRVAQALIEGLNEKHMLLYMRHGETQALIDAAGWSGRILDTPKDYLSVIHTNINGYKTDGVIDETIRHRAEIQGDGSIVDTVTVTRAHRGGNTPYDWWNRVNADYMRVYVPEGSVLLSAKGATWEFPEAPLDYRVLGFKKDADVEREEKSVVIDEKSGTRVFRDAGRTVFGAWVYVSPQESVTVEYRYRLPFRIHMNELAKGGADSYSVLYQKQSGSAGSKLQSSVQVPDGWKTIWQSGTNLVPYGREWKLEDTLKTDKFIGMVFGADR